jgi:hypothetical protein
MKFLALIALIILMLPVSAWQLPASHNNATIAQVQALADTEHFKYAWKNDVFDCVDMSAANYRFLKERGFAPKIAIRKDPENGINASHCYVIVPVMDGWIGLDTQRKNLGNRDLNSSIGAVITTLDMWKVCDSPDEVFAMDPRGPPVITENVILPNLPAIFS